MASIYYGHVDRDASKWRQPSSGGDWEDFCEPIIISKMMRNIWSGVVSYIEHGTLFKSGGWIDQPRYFREAIGLVRYSKTMWDDAEKKMQELNKRLTGGN